LIALIVELCALMDREILMRSFDLWSRFLNVIMMSNELNIDLTYVHPYLVRVIGILRESFVCMEDEVNSEEFKSMRDYRTYAGNCVLEILSYLRQENPKATEELLVSMIHNAIPTIPPATDPKYKLYLHVLESFIFFASALLDEFPISQAPIPYFIDMFKWTFSTQPNSTLASTSLLFVQEGARQFNFVPELITSAIDYSLYAATNFLQLQILAAKTIKEITEICRTNVLPQDIIKVEKLLLASTLKPNAAGVLAASIATYHSNTRKITAEDLMNWIEEELKNSIDSQGTLYALIALNQYIFTLSRHSLTLKETSNALGRNAQRLIPIICSLAEVLKEPLKKEGVKEIVGVLTGLLKTVNLSNEVKAGILQVAMSIWASDASQIEVLKILSMISKETKNLGIDDKVCEQFLLNYQNISKEQFIYTLHSMTNYLKDIITDETFITSKHIELTLSVMCQFILTDYERDVNNNILALFKIIIELNPINYKGQLELIKHNLLCAAIQSIPFEQANLMLLSKLLISAFNSNAILANSALENSLSTIRFKETITDEGKRLVIEFINKFKGDKDRIKEILISLYNLLNSFRSIDELMKFQKRIDTFERDQLNVITIE